MGGDHPKVRYREAEIIGDHLGGWLPQMCRSIYCALFCPCNPSNHIWKVMKSIVPRIAELEETLGHIMSFEQVNQKTRNTTTIMVKTKCFNSFFHSLFHQLWYLPMCIFHGTNPVKYSTKIILHSNSEIRRFHDDSENSCNRDTCFTLTQHFSSLFIHRFSNFALPKNIL